MGLIDFKTNFNGGTRTNRFKIDGSFPGGAFTNYHVRATTIPSVATKTMSYDYFGRKFHYPGEKEYGTWSFQAWDDIGSNNMWSSLQYWQNLINEHDTNISSELRANSGVVASYKADEWKIQHLNLNGDDSKILKEFKLYGCWPAAIQPISFNMGNPNVLNSFNVIVVFDHIEITNITKNI